MKLTRPPRQTFDEVALLYNEARPRYQPIYERYNFLDIAKPTLPGVQDLKPDEIEERLFKLIYFQLFPVVIRYRLSYFR